VVEISSLGSGEGRGWVTGPGYSTRRFTIVSRWKSSTSERRRKTRPSDPDTLSRVVRSKKNAPRLATGAALLAPMSA
jgi:hypothetical protein